MAPIRIATLRQGTHPGVFIASVLAIGVFAAPSRFIPGEGSPTSPTPQPGSRPTGAQLYATHCAACHGDNGDGAGPAARFLYPKPRDFGEAKFRIVSTTTNIPGDDDLKRVLKNGMPGSAMVPFGHLDDAEITALIGHVRQLVRDGIDRKVRQVAKETGDDPDDKEIADKVVARSKVGDRIAFPAKYPESSGESVARGAELYKVSCSACHGPTGKGDGQQEMKNDDGIPTRPRDLTKGIFKSGRDKDQLYARIFRGMPGSPMPATTSHNTEQIGDMINFILSLSPPDATARTEHRRQTVVAKKVTAIPDFAAAAWSAVPARPVVVTPLWWRDYADPNLTVSAVHDGKTLAIRLTWVDASRNDAVVRPEDFEDMAAVQLFKGAAEPFLGMGSESGVIDLWHWRAGPDRAAAFANSKLDDYPFDAPQYKDLLKDKSKSPPDQITARAAGNPNVGATGGASSLTAKGPGSTTARPKTNQKVSAKAEWKAGVWTVVLTRPLAVAAGDGIPLKPGDRCSIATALWDGAAKDRNGQKLVSVWHDLTIE